MKTITIKDKQFVLSISSAEIQQTIAQLAERIDKELKANNPLFIIVMNGALMFASDLLKKINFHCEISCVKFSSYCGTERTLHIKKLIGLDENITRRTVIILEDIIDTGSTTERIITELKQYNPAVIKTATLLFKPHTFRKNYTIDYIGLEIPDDFIVGYGLDYDGLGRNLPDIYKIIN